MEASADLRVFNQLFADYQGRFIRFANSYVRDSAVIKRANRSKRIKSSWMIKK